MFPQTNNKGSNYPYRFFCFRFIAFLLTAVLLAPMFFISDFGKMNAQSSSGFSKPLIVPNAAPPEAFQIQSPVSKVQSPGFFLSNRLANLSGFFSAPPLPEGFAAAKPVSPASAFLSSVGNSTASFFGFFAFSKANESANAAPAAPFGQPTGSVEFDFDNDNKADIARRRASNNNWEIKYSSNGTTNIVTSSAGNIAPADYDGDNKTDVAVFNAGTWTIVQSSNGQTISFSLGQADDKPVSGDYDGDGKADAAVYRPTTGNWYVRQSGNGNQVATTAFGTSPDIAVPGNYDGDTKMDYAVFRPASGAWHFLLSASGYGYGSFQWGLGTDVPVAADYDGDGKTDFAVYRPSSATWYAYKSSTNNGEFISRVWGGYGDQPAPADFDGDNKADFAILRPTTGVWHIVKSSNSAYDYQALGVLGDTAVSSAYIKQIGTGVTGYEMARKRLSPQNATGGTNLYSRNFSWGTSLAGLPGRAGLDAGFGISYNSLIWTRQDAAVYFDVDMSNVSPGFRFGFPTIESAFFDDFTNGFSYLMVTPSGARVRFDQTAVSDTYETVDSSYAQLKTIGAVNPNDPVENITISVTTTDGTVMSYEWKGGAFRCSRIKDRNGNYITVNHDALGLLRSVTDTLGRIITVEYDTELFPTAIKQTWKNSNGAGSDVTHTWATFTYTGINITTNFGSLLVYGPSNGTLLKVLQNVTYADGSASYFDYNGYGQVWKVRNIAADSQAHLLNYVRTNLQTPSGTQTDCPRFTETASWTENFNNNQETVVTNTFQTGQSYNVGGVQGTGTLVQAQMSNHPHGAISKTFYGESNWTVGLPAATEDWATESGTSVRKRWTWTNWTQDNTNLTYIKNPRVVETKVGDATNTKRTTIDYYPVSQGSPVALYGLVSEVKVYASDQTTVWKKAVTEYNSGTAYVSRRIIGLPSKTEISGYDQASSQLKLVSKVTYNYDEGNFSDTDLQQNIAPINHDTAGFGASFIIGRGNLTSTTRWNVDYPASSSEAVTSSVKYNTAGAIVAQTDPLARTVKISYADKFNDNINNRNTFAYPSKVTDPAGNFSEVKYRYDIGTNVWAKSPAPAGNTSGKETTREFDSIGRLSKEKINNYGGAYTRYEYPANGVQSKVYSTVIDTNSNGADAADEIMSESWMDGAGRVRFSRTEHPGSVGGWSGSKVEYDMLGRAVRSTVPTEINPVNPNDPSSWTPAGDDTGWLWTHQKYDWMGRVVRKINTNGVDAEALNNSDVLISYEGCGCAGGLITTIQSELVPRDDLPNTNARRTQKIYEDILGRNWKMEVLKWDGSVYTTALTTFNGRDQASSIVQQDNTQNPFVTQTTTMTYDGHGRVKTQKRPEQDANKNTTYNYYQDDSILSVVDARGATANYTYNSRGLVEQVSYSVPSGSTIPVPANVNFSYDALGNRTSMQDGLGTVNYAYSELSQMVSETRAFNDTLANAPLPNNGFKLEYSYSLSGKLKSLKEPFGQQINYGHDKIGRLQSVTGTTAYAGIQNYATNAQYRAWGALKHYEYGNGTQTNMTFNNRLQVNHYEYLNSNYQQPVMMSKNYEYYNDGRLKYVQNPLDYEIDRLQIYDHAGRMKEAKSSLEASGQTVQPQDQQQFLPYRQSYQYNAFGNLTQRNNLHWGLSAWNGQNFNLSFTYQNNRITNSTFYSAWQYDADGRATQTYLTGDAEFNEYDAAGILKRTYQNQNYDVTRYLNGEGQELKRLTRRWGTYDCPPPGCAPHWIDETRYYIRSSVLGGEIISEVLSDGKKHRSYVRAAGMEVAWQNVKYEGTTTQQSVIFQHLDASAMSYTTSFENGHIIGNWIQGTEGSSAELDPMGNNMGMFSPYIEPEPPQEGQVCTGCEANDASELEPLGIDGQRIKYLVDGIEASPAQVRLWAQMGALGAETRNAAGQTDYTPIEERLGRLFYADNIRVIAGEKPIVESLTWEFTELWGVSWTPQGQSQQQGRQDNQTNPPERDCNKEAGLSEFDAIPREAADYILKIVELEGGITPEALAITWRFEGTFYKSREDLTFNSIPNANKNQYMSKGTKKKKPQLLTPSKYKWDYGPFQVNWSYAYNLSNNKTAPYTLNDLQDAEQNYAFGTLGSENFDGDIVANGRLAARMIKANGLDEAHQVSWYPGAEKQKQRLQDYNQFRDPYKKFFDCWRATR